MNRAIIFGWVALAMGMVVAGSALTGAIDERSWVQVDHPAIKYWGDTDEPVERLEKKLEAGTAARPLVKTPQLEPVSSMMIANPFNVRSWFSTHPPMAERIARLERMAGS